MPVPVAADVDVDVGVDVDVQSGYHKVARTYHPRETYRNKTSVREN